MKPVLVVDDEIIMRESLREWLTESGYQVEIAQQGQEALKAIKERDFGLLILDIRLPGKNGLEVLKEARAYSPQIKGIIMTAYPTVETAVEAMKVGAIDYLPKPFQLNELEKVVQETLGPVQLEVKPKAVIEDPAIQPTTVEDTKVEEAIIIAAEEIPIHLKQGKAYFRAGLYQEALREFQAVLTVAPGNIETRVWLRKIDKMQEGMTQSGGAVAEGEAQPKYCVWMTLGMAPDRLCSDNYDCLNCEFDQTMQEKMASGEVAGLDKGLSGSPRLCRYALTGHVSFRYCCRLFQCVSCEFGQVMDDVVQQQLTERATQLVARQEALSRKEQSWWWRHWG